MSIAAGDTPAEAGHYFDQQPQSRSRRRRLTLALPDLTCELVADRGVFSAERIDPGTRLLLLEGPAVHDHSEVLVDLGCGYGPIARTLAERAPRRRVLAVDVNPRAVELAAENLAGIPGAEAMLVDNVPDDLRVDEVWSNPPIRIGKPALHQLLASWRRRLRPGGRMVLVVQKHLGSDSLQRWCTDQGWACRRVASRQSYRVLEIDGPDEEPPR